MPAYRYYGNHRNNRNTLSTDTNGGYDRMSFYFLFFFFVGESSTTTSHNMPEQNSNIRNDVTASRNRDDDGEYVNSIRGKAIRKKKKKNE